MVDSCAAAAAVLYEYQKCQAVAGYFGPGATTLAVVSVRCCCLLFGLFKVPLQPRWVCHNSGSFSCCLCTAVLCACTCQVQFYCNILLCDCIELNPVGLMLAQAVAVYIPYVSCAQAAECASLRSIAQRLLC